MPRVAARRGRMALELRWRGESSHGLMSMDWPARPVKFFSAHDPAGFSYHPSMKASKITGAAFFLVNSSIENWACPKAAMRAASKAWYLP